MLQKIINMLGNLFESLFSPFDSEKEKIMAMDEAGWIALLALKRSTEGIFSLFPYDNPLVAKAIWEIKHKANAHIVTMLSKITADCLAEELSDIFHTEGFAKTAIIAIPSHKKKRLRKGFNQSELLGKEIAKNLSLPFDPSVLVKRQETTMQKKLSRLQRKANLHGSMHAFTTKNYDSFILIDDVLTTGSTFEEARRALHEAGIEKCICISIAH